MAVPVTEVGTGDGRKRWNVEKKTDEENDIVIHPTLCRKLRLKDAKLEACRLPRVRYRSSNRVNNCFTLTHTLVLLEAKLPSCRSCCRDTLCQQGRARKLLQSWQSVARVETRCCYLGETNRSALGRSGTETKISYRCSDQWRLAKKVSLFSTKFNSVT